MHPILFRRERFLLYLAAWIPIAGILGALVKKAGTLTWGESLLLTVPMAIVYAFVCLTSFYLCRTFPLRSTEYPRLFWIYALGAVLSSGLWILVGQALGLLFHQGLSFPPLTGENESIIQLFFLIGILLFLLTVFMHYLMIAVDDSRAKEQQALQQSVLAREAELRAALRAQIHPHFLFNSLNSISALTTSDPSAARGMSIRLAEFLRKTLGFGASESVTLAREIALVEDYLAIEKTRFGSRLHFRKAIEEPALRCLIPPLILQPLVENAVNHGISHLSEEGTILISAHVTDGRLTIRVENPVDPDYLPARKKGVGLENVKRRLAAIHGIEGRLTAEQTAGRFLAEITAPALPAEE
jgi:sensor histidine kinase YesM